MRKAIALLLPIMLAAGCAGAGSPDATGPSLAATTSTPSTTESPTAPPSMTPPPPDNAPLLRFAAIGDFGSGLEAQYRLAQRMCLWRERHPFNLVVTTGDNVYDTGHPDDFASKFFRPYECLFDAGVRWRAVLGNHDVVTNGGRPELREPAFGMKGRNYVVRKRGVRFVMWDSTISDREWLRQNLRKEPGDVWTVVAFHHPVFSPGVHGSTPGYRPSLPRLFARKGVDLVLNGHDHLYALMPPRSKVRYVVTGGGGAGIYDCANPAIAEVCIERHHFLYVVVRPERVVVRAVPVSGATFHRFVTLRRG